MTGRPLIIDTDGGVDDAVALWWAATSPDIDLVAVTVVWGNVDLDVATGAVLRVLHAAGRPDIPVAVGLAGPIAPAPDLRPATFIHGDDGLGNTHRPLPPGAAPVAEGALELLQRVVRERPGEVAVATIGPLSNVGKLVADDPTWAPLVDELVVMGGAVTRGGNAMPLGEANVAHDPVAAQNVVAADWGRPPLLVGLDVTYVATFSPSELALLAEQRNAAAAFLADPVAFYAQFGSTFTAPNVPCHDLLAVLTLADPGVITEAPVVPLAVDCGGGPAWGATVADLRQLVFARLEGSDQGGAEGFFPWRVALEADPARFRQHVQQLFGS